MISWSSIVSVFGIKSRTAAARLRLVDAYQRVFNGSPSREDQQMVLADLNAKSGFFGACPSGTTAEELNHREGMRYLMAVTIHEKLTLSQGDYDALRNAARLEAAADQEQGEI